LIAKLPAAESAAATKALANLNVRVITIKTVREQMRYDIPRLFVEAGRDFELNFINEDAMPHNIVFVQPGTMQAVAEAAQVIPPTKLDSKGRAYIPENDARIFAASKLIEAGQRETLRVAAPEKEGTYQYVCTFPGHWTIMKGEMIVTKDVEAYLKAHPEK
jgi:azurin